MKEEDYWADPDVRLARDVPLTHYGTEERVEGEDVIGV